MTLMPKESRPRRGRQLFDAAEAKPPYRVPLVSEVAKIKPCGLTVVTTFAGCGGSSLGYRMAGYRIVWANEFVPVAQDSYRANMAKGTILDGRDIKEVTAAEIMAATGLKPGELDLLDGSPPCQAFSTAGKREKGWGTERKYEHGASQKNEDLFDEYVRLRDGLKPRAFVAENVSGLVKGVAKGYFLRILAELKRGYRVEARLLDAQWLGVPQQRQRIIFVGVREDLEIDPAFPAPLPYRYSVRDALPWLGGVKRVGHANYTHFAVEPETDISGQAIGREYDRLNAGQQSDKYFSLVRTDAAKPAPTMTAAGGQNSGIACAVHPTEKRKFSIAELRRICAFPDDFELVGTYAQQWERLGNSVPPVMMFWIASAVRDRVLLPARAPGTRKAKRSAPAKTPIMSLTPQAAISRF